MTASGGRRQYGARRLTQGTGNRIRLLATAVLVAASLTWVAPGTTPTATAANVINVPGDQPTLQAAVQAAASGDTIVLAPGTYQGGVWVQDKSLTIASRYLTTGDPSYITQTVVNGYGTGYCGGASGCAGNVVLEFGSRAGGSLVTGLTVSGGIDGVRGNARVDISHSRLIGNEDGADFGNDSSGTWTDTVFADNTDDGIDLNGRVQINLRNSTVEANQGDGIEFRLYPYTGPTLEVNIVGNRFLHNDSDGIQLIDSDDASSRVIRIQRNVFDHNGAAAIGCLPNQQTNEDFSGAPLAERVHITNNTFNGDRYGISGGANSIVLNNIFTQIPVRALHRVGGGSIASYNLFWNNGTNYAESVVDEQTSVFADPQLAADLTLRAGSPAIDAGTASFTWNGESVLSLPASSYTGTAPDLGAFEYGAGGGTANTPPTVDAGTDQTVTLPATAALDGTVTDDGLPDPPGKLTTTWSQVSGPGTTSFTNPGAVDTTASFTQAGTYVLKLTADDGSATASDTTAVTVEQGSGGPATTTERRVAAGSDDVEQAVAGTVSLSSSDLELTTDGTVQQVVGTRFTNLQVPKAATITNAYVQFQVDEVSTGTAALTIKAENSDNAAAYTSTAGSVTARAVTGGVAWNPPAWSTIDVSGPDQRTPNVASLVQAVVNRAGWVPGNALALQFSGTGRRTAEAFEGTTTGAPLLHVEYTTDGGGTPTNAAPTVNAGPDQTVTLPATATLDGTVSDDGLPNPPGAVSTTWSQLSGPGTTTFTNAASVDTTASFSAAGTYVLQLAADDSAATTADTVTVTVQPASGGGGSGQTVEVRVAAGADDVEQAVGSGSVQLTSSDLELTTDGTTQQVVGTRFRGLQVPRGATVTRAYVQFQVDEVSTDTSSMTIKAENSDNAAVYTSTSGSVTARPTTGAVTWAAAPWPTADVAGADQRTPDIASLVQAVVNRTGWSAGNALALQFSGTGRRTAEAYEGTAAGAPLLHVEFTTDGGGTPSNVPPTVDAGADQTVTLPAGVTLDATVTDDGLPQPPGTLTTTWSQVSGPGTATFADPSKVDTTATFSAAGTYVLQLAASDSAATTTDTVTVTVQPASGGGGGTQTVESRVAAGSDDVEESASGSYYGSSSDLELVYDGSNQLVGLRFAGLAVPRGSTITRAYVQFTTDEAQSEATSLSIHGQAADNALTFSSATKPSTRPRTTTSATWAPAAWTTVGQAGADQRTTDLSAVVQEVVNRPGWVSGNALALIVSGTGHRTARAFEAGAAVAPLLHIEYTPPG